MIRASTLTPVLQALDGRGRKAGRLLSRHGLDRAALTDPYAEIALHRYVAFLEDAAEATGEPHFCAQVGTSFRAADLGPVGLVFGGSATLRAGLGRLAAVLSAWQDATEIRVEAEGDQLVWTYRLADPDLWPRRQDGEYTLAATLALARDAFGAAGRPIAIHVEHPPPDQPAELTRILGTVPHFDQTANRLIFDRTAAEKVQRREDAGLMAILSRHLSDLSRRRPEEDLVAHVRHLVRLQLGLRPVTLALIAGDLKLSPRTLQRRLAEHGASLRDLILEARLELGGMQLRNGKASHAEIARQLGYADSTAFWRAFKQATGRAPSQHRED